jgi:hypothetical protein
MQMWWSHAGAGQVESHAPKAESAQESAKDGIMVIVAEFHHDIPVGRGVDAFAEGRQCKRGKCAAGENIVAM